MIAPGMPGRVDHAFPGSISNRPQGIRRQGSALAENVHGEAVPGLVAGPLSQPRLHVIGIGRLAAAQPASSPFYTSDSADERWLG
ncbi:hypothetical protein PJL18_03712 [Paenarthrobacter nicotinovorans]|nr:hypothetical protein [Paenarthrobacter nicotinovorans]